MARCTLDDLVPSFKCKRVFLEPHTGNGNFNIQIEGCVYDDINDEDGIVDYLMSDTFGDNIRIRYLWYQGSAFQGMVEFLASFWNTSTGYGVTTGYQYTGQGQADQSVTSTNGLSPAIQSMVLDVLIENFDSYNWDFPYSGQDAYDWVMNKYGQTVLSTGTLAGDIFRQTNFMDTFKELAAAIYSGWQEEEQYHLHSFPHGIIDFSGYSAELKENHSNKVMDEDGNLTYEFLIPREELTMLIPNNFTTVYFYAIPYFDITNLVQDVTIPLTAETVNFFFKETHVCHILQNNIAASSAVQDFRIISRIGEIIQPHRINAYDAVIDGISTISRDTQRDKIGLCSDLFFSYRQMLQFGGVYANTHGFQTQAADIETFQDSIQPQQINTGTQTHTNGIFYINFGQLLKRNSRHSFIYDNIYDNEFMSIITDSSLGINTEMLKEYKRLVIENAHIIKLDIYRVRTDIEEYDRVRVATLDTIERLPNTLSDMVGFSFDDIGFRHLTYGTYVYELDMEVVDPIFNLIEEHVHNLKYGISVYTGLIEYIHNNAQNYNELIDTLNTQAQADMTTLALAPSEDGSITHLDWTKSFDFLFLLFTGISLYRREEDLITALEVWEYILADAQTDPTAAPYIAALTMLNEMLQMNQLMMIDTVGFERRKVETFLQIMQDLLFAIDRFFEVEAITSTSSTSVQSSAELVSYSRRWNVEADPRIFDLGCISLAPSGQLWNGLSLSMYRTRMEQELELYSMTNNYNDAADLGCLTPQFIGREDIDSANLRTESFMKIYSSLLDMPEISKRELEIYDQLMSSEDQYFSSVHELKNNSGMSEAFLNTLGGSCENLSVHSINTDIYSDSVFNKRDHLFGIDEAKNEREEDNTISPWTSEDDEEAIPIEEQRASAKEDLVIELRKKEHFIMKFLTNRKGYSVLDRLEYKQGDYQTKRYDHNYNFWGDYDFSKAYPEIIRYNTTLTRGASATPAKEVDATMLRYLLDNVYLVYYMSGISQNMNPTWTHLVDINSAIQAKNDLGVDRLICKFKRYQDTNQHIGQGAPSDREILFRYFYLFV